MYSVLVEISRCALQPCNPLALVSLRIPNFFYKAISYFEPLSLRFALGVAITLYQDGTLSGGGIRSRTRSMFTAMSKDTSQVTNRRATTSSFTATETFVLGDEILGVDQTEVSLYEVVDEQKSQSSDVRIVEGEFVEENEFDDVHGLNATLGAWWIVNDFLTLGASVDLPWSADSEQTRKVTTSSTTFNESKTRVLGGRKKRR